MASSNYSILADIELNTASVKTQLATASKSAKLKLDVESSSVKEANTATQNLNESVVSLGVSYQVANQILTTTVNIITSMVSQVMELDSAITDFKKVSDLTGESLDNYVAKLADMGSQVARTGKPKRLSLNVRMVNVH